MTRRERLQALDRDGRLDLPSVGSGGTAERWRALAELARHDVAEARLAEAHLDARQILHEAGRTPASGDLYGVWASEHPRWTVTATPQPDGGWVLDGAKAFCTGAGLLDRALITARAPAPTPGRPDGGHGDEGDRARDQSDTGDGARPGDRDRSHTGDGEDGSNDRGETATVVLLLDVDLGGIGAERIDPSMWAAPALAETVTAVVDLTGIVVPADAVVGDPGWYLDRPGFWDGAIGPAACWAGAALGLVDHARAHPPSDPHGRAHLGALDALAWSLTASLDQAGREIDADAAEATEAAGTADARPDDAAPTAARARRRALTVRHLVDVTCAEIQDRFARALGPRPLVSDPSVIERDQALSLYRRQCHAERDLEALGDLVVTATPAPLPA